MTTRMILERRPLLRLHECPPGLFETREGTVGFKSEYADNGGRLEAYILESGEAFWGAHPQTVTTQRMTPVHPLTLTVAAHPAPGPFAAFGRMVSDTVETVAGMTCICPVLVAPEGRRVGSYGAPIAYAYTRADAELLASAPALTALLRRAEHILTALAPGATMAPAETPLTVLLAIRAALEIPEPPAVEEVSLELAALRLGWGFDRKEEAAGDWPWFWDYGPCRGPDGAAPPDERCAPHEPSGRWRLYVETAAEAVAMGSGI